MKPVSILPLAIALATTCAIGQDTVLHRSANPASLSFSHTPTVRGDCPVGLQVNHGSSFLKREVEYGQFAPPPPAVGEQRIQIQEQTIEFIVDNPSTREIVKAQITVHGLSHQGRFVPLPDGPAPDLSRKVSVVLDVKGNSRSSSDLSLSRFAAVTSVDLNSLTYADGATWRASSQGACSVTPNPFMLVSTAR
jgi:hypothetical protein